MDGQKTKGLAHQATFLRRACCWPRRRISAATDLEVSGAAIAMDPFTGRVLAMVRGFFVDESEFNQATQAQRQPTPHSSRSSMRRRSTTAIRLPSTVLDSPIAIDDGSGHLFWEPHNFEGTSSGPHPLASTPSSTQST